MKVDPRNDSVPDTLEIVLTHRSNYGLFAGFMNIFTRTFAIHSLETALQLFSAPARMIRPVVNMRTNSTEYVGTFEQVSLLL